MKGKKKFIIIIIVVLLLFGLYKIGENQRTLEVNSQIDVSGITKTLESNNLKVYSASEFKEKTGMSVFDIKPNKTMLAYISMPISDVIEWYDGKKGYACLGEINTKDEDSKSSLSPFKQICQDYPFEIILASINDRIMAYSTDASYISDYEELTKITVDKTYTDIKEFVSALN